MIKPEDSLIILVNYKPEFFAHSFSKMEFLMGMDYMNNFRTRFKIPVMFTERELYYPIGNKDVLNFLPSLKVASQPNFSIFFFVTFSINGKISTGRGKLWSLSENLE